MAAELRWRRRFKPTLDVIPWSQVTNIDGPTADRSTLVKTLFHEDCYELAITDLERVWCEELDGPSILKRNKKLNPNVEAPLDKLLDHIQSKMDQSDTEFTFKLKEENHATLTIRTTLAGLPFIWKYHCKSSPEYLRDHLTSPLLTMVGEMNRREEELVKLLKAKDREIDDLKAQGVRVSRKHLETGPFVPTAFRNTMATSKEFEKSVMQNGKTAFADAGKELYRDVMTKLAWLHRTDRESDEEDDMDADGEPTGASWAQRAPPSIGKDILAPSVSAARSPSKSPTKSPKKGRADQSPVKDVEIQRREALEKRLAEEQDKKEIQKKKKKKLKL